MTNPRTKHLAGQPYTRLHVPEALRTSIERHACTLIELVSELLHSGMEQPQLRAVLTQASLSYSDELISTIISLKNAP